MTANSPATLGTTTPALLRAALEAAGEAVVLCDTADDRVLLVNAAAVELIPGLTAGGPATIGPLADVGTATTFAVEHRGRHLQGYRRDLGGDRYGWYLRDRTDEVLRSGALEAERARTAFLAEAGRRLAATLHQGRCLRIAAELAATHLADGAVVLLPAERRRHRWVRVVGGHPVEEGVLLDAQVGEVPGLDEALGGFPPIPSRWLDPAQAPGWLFPGDFGPIGALLVIPLPGNAEPAGALVLARVGPGGAFGEEDEALARIFAARTGAALSSAALYREQVDTTAVLQADLLPPELPSPDGIELAGSYQAARDAARVGGDFYDAFGPDGDATDTVVVLGDVCGTGPEAAVLTGKVRQTLRALRLVGTPPADMLHVLNQALLRSARSHRFVTLVVGSVQRAEHGRLRLGLATGGHPPPLVLRLDGTVEEVPVRGTLIGAVPRTTVEPAVAELGPGELCLLFSDGLTEARGGPTATDQFGEERLRAALSECAGMPAGATVERLRQLVSDWVHGGARDDIAMLAVRAPNRTPLSLRSGARNQSPFAIDARRRARVRT